MQGIITTVTDEDLSAHFCREPPATENVSNRIIILDEETGGSEL
jgi:hypothetical protein